MKEIENLDSEFNKVFKKELELRESWRKRNGRFIDSLGPEGRYKAFKKIREKYESDEYIRSEYSKGYEPRGQLFGVILDYAEALDPDIDFCVSKFHIDNTWVIRLFIGRVLSSVLILFQKTDIMNASGKILIEKFMLFLFMKSIQKV